MFYNMKTVEACPKSAWCPDAEFWCFWKSGRQKSFTEAAVRVKLEITLKIAFQFLKIIDLEKLNFFWRKLQLNLQKQRRFSGSCLCESLQWPVGVLILLSQSYTLELYQCRDLMTF